ncbi:MULTISPECIES: hypothetical protein [Priestia]|uniref:hypothetical protein n=1 Tax=Priestia TaxID=2800373 RepID=UPI0012A84C40|nr:MULTISPECIES: hypothetical protein [Priestia]MBY0210787.1 hypothetical protein [Priestia aryabhattai]NGY86570.1 hypothetical protein [Priestia megaterium]QFY73489.1 hypothetical protein CEQ83_13460 [Priestia megaterium]
MIGEQGEDSCGKSGIGETPQERMRRGGSAAARGKRSLARKSNVVYQATHMSSCIPFVRLQIGLVWLCLNLFFMVKFIQYD